MNTLSYRPDIDGLRAIAICSVVFFHVFPNGITGGFIGVDIFFVISGYLISSIIFENLNRKTFCFSTFYARRIKRIFPALILVLLACLILGSFVLFTDEYHQLSLHTIASVSFFQNIILWKESGYFDNAAETKPLLHIWSLCIEEQFYLIWPLLMWVAWKRNLSLIILIFSLLFISFFLNLNEANKDIVEAFYFPHTRFWELLSGSLLAWFMVQRKEFPWVSNSNFLANIYSCLGCICLLFGLFYINKSMNFPGKWACIPVLGTFLIILAGANAWFNRIILSNRALVWIGLISFPLYLWHWPLLAFAKIIEGNALANKIRIAIVLLSILLAWLTYQLIELPIRKGQNSNRLKVGVLIVSLFGIVCFSYYIYNASFVTFASATTNTALKQIGWQLPVGSPAQIDSCRHMFPIRSQMTSKERDDNFCYLQKAGKPNILMVGDSVNLSIFPGLSKYNDYNLLVLSASAAAPFYNIRTTELNDTIRVNNFKLTNQALDYALAHDNIKLVIMSFSGGALLTDPSNTFKITDVLHPSNHNAKEIFITAASKTIKKLLAKHKKIIYVLPDPLLDFDINQCLKIFRPFAFTDNVNNVCSMSAESYYAREKEYRHWVDTLLKKFPQVNVFDASKSFCNENKCVAIKNGQLLYRDIAHLSIDGSTLLASSLHDFIIDTIKKSTDYSGSETSETN